MVVGRRRGGTDVIGSTKPSRTSGLTTVALELSLFPLDRPPWNPSRCRVRTRRAWPEARGKYGGPASSSGDPDVSAAPAKEARAHASRDAPPPSLPAPSARRTLGRSDHVGRRLVAFRARLSVIDGARTAAAPPSPPPPPPGVEPAAARGLRVCLRRCRRPASAMDLFGDLPEPERSPRPAAGERGPPGREGREDARAAGLAAACRPAAPEAGGGEDGRASGPAPAGPGRPEPAPCSLRRKGGLAGPRVLCVRPTRAGPLLRGSAHGRLPRRAARPAARSFPAAVLSSGVVPAALLQVRGLVFALFLPPRLIANGILRGFEPRREGSSSARL